MNEKEYFRKVFGNLRGPLVKRWEIIRELKQHWAESLKEKTSRDSGIIERLGDPFQLAHDYNRSLSRIWKAQKWLFWILSSLGTACALAFGIMILNLPPFRQPTQTFPKLHRASVLECVGGRDWNYLHEDIFSLQVFGIKDRSLVGELCEQRQRTPLSLPEAVKTSFSSLDPQKNVNKPNVRWRRILFDCVNNPNCQKSDQYLGVLMQVYQENALYDFYFRKDLTLMIYNSDGTQFSKQNSYLYSEGMFLEGGGNRGELKLLAKVFYIYSLLITLGFEIFALLNFGFRYTRHKLKFA
ncbi:MAG: hypothetical protein EOP04_00215 [Proteobacteria bacterium]|nr:MAG: hypothetical protein EOP04_00215 [Pseudomonadota bacterium]